MRAFTSSVESFLEGPRRRVNRLSLEFFITGNAGCMNRLIAEAIDAWGVDDLEAVAKPTFRQRGDVHTFPSHGLCKEPRASRLRRLELGGCVLPPLHEYGALTILVLRDLPESTPAAAYEGVFTSCPQLQTLHLISCRGSRDRGISSPVVVVDAPGSEIRELVVDHCKFQWLLLRALPRLQSLASLGSLVLFESTSFPCLRQWNLAWRIGVTLEDLRQHFAQHLKLKLDMFLRCTPDITNLIIRFTGPDRWIVPSSSPSSYLPNLRRLLVADVPSSWDVSWPRLLFEIAPSLEALHIHISPCEDQPGEEISWQPAKLRLHHLKEFVVAGFEGTVRQIYLVKFVVGICMALNHVAMFKNGHARDKGLWDWEIATQQHSWTDEKDSTLKQIMDGVSSSTAPIQLVLG
uniref:FBD domain-containing protein n=1 Tax=Arundo donax TaxID=35708 RepID=A0A0A9DCB1_ARUDO